MLKGMQCFTRIKEQEVARSSSWLQEEGAIGAICWSHIKKDDLRKGRGRLILIKPWLGKESHAKGAPRESLKKKGERLLTLIVVFIW